MGEVLSIVYRTLSTHLIKQAGYTRATAHTGSVTLIQRFGSALSLNLHFHLLFLDSVYAMDSVSLSAFLARRVLQAMVVPFPKDATQTRDADKLTRRALPWRPADSVAALIKGTTIDGAGKRMDSCFRRNGIQRCASPVRIRNETALAD